MTRAVQDIVRENIARNAGRIAAAGGAAAARELTWGVTRAAELDAKWAEPDLVVAADVVYRRELFQPLLRALADLCAPSLAPPSALFQHAGAVKRTHCTQTKSCGAHRSLNQFFGGHASRSL
jgi:hypothetical protein